MGLGVVKSKSPEERLKRSMTGPSYSQRRPRFTVKVRRTRQSSCTKREWNGLASARESFTSIPPAVGMPNSRLAKFWPPHGEPGALSSGPRV